MTPVILKTLSEIEAKHSVHIQYAIESGSRAWGFESRDSDYDIRFVYTRRLSEYLTVLPRRDVIENSDIKHPDPEALLDFAGWDIRKFLGLVSKSNPVAFEWMQSPIAYRAVDAWPEIYRRLCPFFSPRAAMLHYLSMTRHNYREHMRDGASPSVKLKKYLYITRPLLCCLWMEQRPNGGPPPMLFLQVLADVQIDRGVTQALCDLVARKRAAEELDDGAAIPEINRFIDTELWRLPMVAQQMPAPTGNAADLDALLCASILRTA